MVFEIIVSYRVLFLPLINSGHTSCEFISQSCEISTIYSLDMPMVEKKVVPTLSILSSLKQQTIL